MTKLNSVQRSNDGFVLRNRVCVTHCIGQGSVINNRVLVTAESREGVLAVLSGSRSVHRAGERAEPHVALCSGCPQSPYVITMHAAASHAVPNLSVQLSRTSVIQEHDSICHVWCMYWLFYLIAMTRCRHNQ